MEKKKFSYEGYDDYLYTGLQGFVMRRNHRILSRDVDAGTNRKILEIGGGAKLHGALVDLAGVEEYWVSDAQAVFDEHPDGGVGTADIPLRKHYADADPDYRELFESGHRFSRIIASHVWEHVRDPEGYLLKWVDLLEDDGQIDIAIPCDPGWTWRLGQLVGKRKAIETYGMTSREIDLKMTREHVNPCQNLIRIMKYYANSEVRYFPTRVPITDMNLFVFFRARKGDFSE